MSSSIVRKQLMLAALSSIAIAVIAWGAYRIWEYHRLEPLRNAVSSLKDSKYEFAIEQIAPFAREGNKHAQELMGYIYAFGLGLPEDDVQAQIWFRRAERDGDELGYNEYGVALGFSNGFAGRKDATAASRWMQIAAEAGNTKAQTLLADPAVGRRGFRVDPQIAEYWRKHLARSPS
jgi:TPR repeat protein